MLEALIFDVDGTLAETEEAHREAFNAAFAEAGLGWVWERALYSELLKVTGGKERIRHFMATVLRRDPLAADTDALVAMLHRRKTTLYGELIAAGTVGLRPGIAAVLAASRRSGIRLAIATTTSRPNVDALLAATLGADAAATFEVIVAGDEVASKKPAPDVYLEALRLLRLDAAQCLAVEDSANGVRSARGAGIPVLVTRGMYTAHDDCSGALADIDDLLAIAPRPRGVADGPALLDALRALHHSSRAPMRSSRKSAP